MEEIPDDLRHLDSFPQYDATFQDHPSFRRNLERWADRTDKLATGLTGLAESFDQFHETGMQHFQAANGVVQKLKGIASLCQNDSGNTITTHIEQFVETMNKISLYYEAFLGQTQMLNIEPVREMANGFSGVKKLHEQMLQYRREHLEAAEKLCACKHSSRLTDKSTLSSLSEACFTSQRTYQLVLSKFVLSLRESHTIDMMSFVRRVIEHLLSLYSYHNYCTDVLKDLEPQMSDLFSKTKDWRKYYEKDLKLRKKLHFSVKKNIMAEYQRNMCTVPSSDEASHTWSDVAMAPITAGRNIMKPFLRMFPSQGHKDVRLDPAVSGDPSEWVDVEDEGQQPRRATYPHIHPHPHPHPHTLPHTHPADQHTGMLEAEVPTQETVARVGGARSTALNLLKRRKAIPKVVRSLSNPDLLSDTFNISEDIPEEPTTNGAIPTEERVEVPPSSSPLVVSLTETAGDPLADDSEAFLPRNISHSVSSSLRPLTAVRGRARGRRKALLLGRRGRKPFTSLDDMSLPEEPLQSEGADSGPSSPAPGRKPSQSSGIFKKAKDSLRYHLMNQERQLTPPAESLDSYTDLSSDTQSVGEDVPESGRKKKKKKSLHSEAEKPEKQAQPRPSISGPLPRESSGSELRSEDLRGLVLPAPRAWALWGYLWLRMRTSNNRYAWTHVFCIVNSARWELLVQRDGESEPRCLENLLLCHTKLCTPDFIDRNYCFRVISPTSEHLFQALSSQEQEVWAVVLQDTTARAIKMSPSMATRRTEAGGRIASDNGGSQGGGGEGDKVEVVADAMSVILAVPGNSTCADCNNRVIEWASVNLGIVLCIKCSGVHRSLGVHVSKVRSLNLDKWDRQTVDFMLRQGNSKANTYYEATLGQGQYELTRRPAAGATKVERSEFIQQKYVALAFVPPFIETSNTL